ncbi:geranylgeranyl pyrophosphate synthase [Umbelopsis sp. PMI_123]|nr:geranylgeranyl pyrophosphate synthase [Umbelopsis sp. PMI_123]
MTHSIANNLTDLSDQDLLLDHNDNILLEPFRYLCEHPGKDIRSRLIEAFDYYMHVPPAQLNVITKVIEMLHNASLLVDDVEDDSDLRRGVPVAHKIYGIAQTVNCANYVYFLALNEIIKLGNSKMVDIYTEELINLHRGQGMELFWRDSLTCPTQEEYIDMVNNKTGGLLRLGVKLMQEASKSDKDYTSLVNKIGIHFQVRDDYMNLQSQQYTDNKGFCEDFTEGKFSFPVIHSIRADPSNRQLLNILKQKSTSVELKRFGLQLLEKTNTFNYCLEFLKDMEQQARVEIKHLGANPKLDKIMDMLSVPLPQ